MMLQRALPRHTPIITPHFRFLILFADAATKRYDAFAATLFTPDTLLSSPLPFDMPLYTPT